MWRVNDDALGGVWADSEPDAGGVDDGDDDGDDDDDDDDDDDKRVCTKCHH